MVHTTGSGADADAPTSPGAVRAAGTGHRAPDYQDMGQDDSELVMNMNRSRLRIYIGEFGFISLHLMLFLFIYKQLCLFTRSIVYFLCNCKYLCHSSMFVIDVNNNTI